MPAWFRNVDTLFAKLEILEEVQGAVILPFLSQKTRAFVACHSDGEILSYPVLKKKVLNELRLMANEYKRLFFVTRRAEGESWNQFTTKIETYFYYYMKARKIETLEQLRELIIADRLKQIMADDLRTYVVQNETGGWLRPRELARLTDNFEESQRGKRNSGKASPCNDERKPGQATNTKVNPEERPERKGLLRCHGCEE